MLLRQRTNLADQKKNHSKSICVPRPLSVKQVAKITFILFSEIVEPSGA